MKNYKSYGDELQDVNTSGKRRPWKEKKRKSLSLSESYGRLGNKRKSAQVQQCGSRLVFGECEIHHYKKLTKAYFCKNRLCPMCNWRRSNMLSKQIIDILHTAVTIKPMKFIFLTLTIKNCEGKDLSKTIDKLFLGIKRLFKLKIVNDNVLGYVRTLEITHNTNKHSKSYNTYHPHFHILLGVRPSYFNKGNYISQNKWIEMWQNALKIEYKPTVYVQKVKPKKVGQDVHSAVLETGKYAIKDSDYILPNKNETDRAVEILDKALKGRRLIAFGKLFRQVKRDLKLQDIESAKADLVGYDDKKDCKCPICQSELKEKLYEWHYGLVNYYEKNEK